MSPLIMAMLPGTLSCPRTVSEIHDPLRKKPDAAAVKQTTVTLVGWGSAQDPDGDCKFSAQNDKLTIAIPGTDHALCIEQDRMNAPRVLALSDLLRVLTLALVAVALVPGLGPIGAAFAKLSAKLVGAAFTLSALWWLARQARRIS